MEAKVIIKRSRSSNWSETEKALLTQFIKEKINVIENKDVTKNNNLIKKAAWQEILQNFNQINDVKRDLTQLVNQWRNTKNNIKKRNYEYRRSCNATGGGPPPPSPPAEDVEIMQILPSEFEIEHNIYDSDSLNLKEKKDNMRSENNVNVNSDQPGLSGTSVVIATQPDKYVIMDTDMSENNYTQMETPQLSKLADKKDQKNSTKKRTKKKVTEETSQSRELFVLAKAVREKQMQNQEAEHKLRMEIMEKEHCLRLEILQKEFLYWENKLEL